MRKIISGAVVLILFIFAYHEQALAQSPPPGQEPGAQAERYKYDVEKEKKRLEYKKPKAPKIEVEKEKVKPVTEGPSFVLKEVNVTGSTVFKPQDFRQIYEPHLNKKITFKDLQDIVEKIKAKYKEKGYLTTTAYIPEQEIVEGKIEIRVVEGKMGDLKIEGNKRFSSSLIEKYFHVKKNEILNIKNLQKDILRLNQNPDLEVKAVISTGKEPETSDMTLNIKENFPDHVGVSFDNQGTRLTGKYRSALSIHHTNFLGFFDSFFMNTLLTSRSFGESISYSIPLNTYGTKFGLDATYFKMKLGKEYKSFDITGNTQIYTPHILWELCLSEDFQANADIGIEIKSVEKKIAGDITTSDELRLPYFGFDFTKTDSFLGGGQNVFTPRFTFGTEHFLGASSRNHPTASRTGTGGFFFKYEHSLSRIQRMPLESYILMRSQFQAASHTLPSSEQFQIGGANSVRGYPEGDYLADMGGDLNLDWVFPMYLIPREWKLPGQDTALRHQIKPVFFMDLGGGKLKETMPGEKKDKFLMGIGGGIRVNLNRNLFLKLDWAKDIGDEPSSGSGPSTFYLTFQSEI